MDAIALLRRLKVWDVVTGSLPISLGFHPTSDVHVKLKEGGKGRKEGSREGGKRKEGEKLKFSTKTAKPGSPHRPCEAVQPAFPARAGDGIPSARKGC